MVEDLTMARGSLSPGRSSEATKNLPNNYYLTNYVRPGRLEQRQLLRCTKVVLGNLVR